MKFSVCIPNYNYAHYLPDTIAGVLAQDHRDLEILVSDNLSTDRSVDAVRSIADPRICLQTNRCNVGYAGNLRKAASMATGDWMSILPSDDAMMPGTLATYARVIDALGADAPRTILSSAVHVIDGDGKRYNRFGPDWKQWVGAKRDEQLSAAAGAEVWVLPASELLRHCLLLLRNPFHFATTTYPKALHDEVEGYSQGGLYNPDKRFAWALLGVADKALIIDAPLFSYRYHDANMDAQQAKSGALKHLTDEYVATFSVGDELLNKAGLSRAQLVNAFIEHDIALRGLTAVAAGNRALARRILKFGAATYPRQLYANRKIFALAALLSLGPVGSWLAALVKGPALRAWERRLRSGSTKID